MFLNRNISNGLAAIIIILFTLAALAVIGLSLSSWPKPITMAGQTVIK